MSLLPDRARTSARSKEDNSTASGSMRFSLRADDLGAVLKRAYDDGELAVSMAMNEVQAGLKDEHRGQTVSAGLGARLAKTWRGKRFPEVRPSINSAAYQLNDVVVGLASGQRPLTVLLQQGTQIAQVFSVLEWVSAACSGMPASSFKTASARGRCSACSA